MLTTGLDILRLLAEATEPLTATAIAERVGLHTSNVSRTLRVLIEAGYVRKPTYHSFAADLGLFALAGHSLRSQPVVTRTAAAIRNLSEHTGCQATLAARFRDEVLYLHRCPPGLQGVVCEAGGWPLHRSVLGLRLILDLPETEALAALHESRRRYGWEQPTPAFPANPEACLAAARADLHAGVLILDGWTRPGHVHAAIRIDGAPWPLALALDGSLAPDRLCAALALAMPALSTALEHP